MNVKVAEGLSIRQRLRWRHLAWVAAGLLGLHVASMFTTPLETAIWITLGLFGALILAVWLSAMKSYGSSMGGWMGPLGISVICFMGPLPLVFSSFVSEARFRVSQPAFDRLLSRSASRHAAPRQLGLIRVEECSWPDWTEWDTGLRLQPLPGVVWVAGHRWRLRDFRNHCVVRQQTKSHHS